MVSADIGTYYEPFFGGGSLFFRLLPDRAILSDLNVQLMEAYRVMRDYPNRLAAVLGQWPNNEATYYRVRNANYSDRIHRAAQLIYLIGPVGTACTGSTAAESSTFRWPKWPSGI